MASQLTHKVAKTFYNVWHSKLLSENYNEFFRNVTLKQSKSSQILCRVVLPLKSKTELNDTLLEDTKEELMHLDAVSSVTQNAENENIIFVELDKKCFIKSVLDSSPTTLCFKKTPKKVIFEFSSPNIAKPFHVGHLRSTIIGNCLANIKKKLGDNIIKMNYLGDWGTQFGLLQVGLNLENYTEEDFKPDPLKLLCNAYIRGNKEAEKNSEVYDQARKIFFELESGNKEIIQSWINYRKLTLQGLNEIYARLGVSFDEYEWESDYNRKKADNVLKTLSEKGILIVDNLGRKVAVCGNKNFPLIKSDNTTLYLMRDLMALIHRRSRYEVEEIYYVVDNGQTDHFNALINMSSELKINEHVSIEHVKFGRIHRMSTRKGKFTPLSDVLNEAQERIFEKQLQSENTKVQLDNKDVADILGVSGVIVNDLKRKRKKDYEFSWEEAVKTSGNSGILLQYTHCRLRNIQKDFDTEASECDPDALSEPEVLQIVYLMAKYEEALLETEKTLEPCTLTLYLLNLAKAISLAYIRLRVKKSEVHVAQQRFTMFRRSSDVLNEGMRLLGLKPLDKM